MKTPVASLLIVCAASLVLHAQVNVLTNRYDPQRTGANLHETILNVANVNPTQFGKLYSYPVDGSVFAQPLYVSGVTIAGAVRNVLYVATMNDKVYAFDADSASATPLWVRDFTSLPAVTPVPITDITTPLLNIVGNVGIQSTPVIDDDHKTIYLVARTKENGAYVQRLHALDITTGVEQSGSPVTIQATAPGTAADATAGPAGTVITFDPKMQAQRAGLALTNHVVLVAWGAHEDIVPSHGWIMGFDATTLARVGVFAVAPDDYLAGIWQAGRAPTIDTDGLAYFATGNGKWDGQRNYGDSLLKFSVGPGGLSLVDYFTPANEYYLNRDDDDLSGSGFTLLPGTNLLLGGGKEGVLYLLNKDNLGHQVAYDKNAVQKFPVNGHVMSGPAYWRTATQQFIYNWAEDDSLKAYEFTGTAINTTPYADGQIVSPGHPGGALTISSDGPNPATAIVWASMPTNENAKHGLHAGMLRAFDAVTLKELWSSERNPARDRSGTLMKFVPPVVANGRVYLPNHDGAVNVYGLFTPDFTIAAAPARQVVSPGSSASFPVTVGSIAAFSGPIQLAASGAPFGATVTFTPASLAGAGTSTVTIAVPANAPPAPYAITVSGINGTLAHFAAPVTLDVNALTGSGAIGIDFVGNGVAMTSSEQAGVVPIANWNAAPGGSRATPLPLVDEQAAATTASVTWTANGPWAVPIVDQPGNVRLMAGYLDTSSTSTTTVTVSGLMPRAYDVYVYVDGDNRTYDRGALYTVTPAGGAPLTASVTDLASTNFAGTFTLARNGLGNYVKFRIDAGGFTLAAAPTAPASGTRRAPVNAVEIVPVAADGPPVAINVNFVGSSPLAMASTETAGVVASTNWNNAPGAVRTTPFALVDTVGRATGATVTWSSNNAWALPITDGPGNSRMMGGYLDTTATSATTVTVSGLPLHTYDVYVYTDGDNRTYDRTASYAISGPGVVSATVTMTDRASTNFYGTFTPASASYGNYVVFCVTGTDFTIKATPASGTNPRAPVNGVQIVPR